MSGPKSALYSAYSVRDLLKIGMSSLQNGKVNEAADIFMEVCDRFTEAGESVPSTALSLYALCLGHQKKLKEAIDTCRLAVRKAPVNATCRLHMAKIYMMADSRRRAVEELEKGLKISPKHVELLEFQKEMGIRKRPVIGFLPRDNPVNVKLGRALRSRKSSVR
jgi:tetratricopeptide (TPR) repeat protein